ncbi:2-hydroxyacid dehydrogenase [Alphaproteobacteria bacterium]|nr:2-hydroxyacid dehydrogenase [Alphaproteobacteria bacterium]
MTRSIAVFGEMGAKYVHSIEQKMAAFGDEWRVDVWPCNADTDARDSILKDCEAAVISADFVLTPGNFGALTAAPNLKLMIQPWVGTDWIDPAFLPKGLTICNAGGHAVPMAEHVLGAMLEHVLELRALHSNMQHGQWHRAGRNSAPEARHGDLSGKTLGILGYGEIAQAVAERAKVFGMDICAIARSERSQTPEPLSWIGTQADLPKLLETSDFIAVTCDLNDQTQGMMDTAAFAMMKPTAYLINVARGEVVDEDALFQALQSGKIAGAALDTWYRYPMNLLTPEADPDRGGAYQGSKHDFISLDNVLLTPHSAAHTNGADLGRYQCIGDTLAAYASGAPLKRFVLEGTGTNMDSFKMP